MIQIFVARFICDQLIQQTYQKEAFAKFYSVCYTVIRGYDIRYKLNLLWVDPARRYVGPFFRKLILKGTCCAGWKQQMRRAS